MAKVRTGFVSNSSSSSFVILSLGMKDIFMSDDGYDEDNDDYCIEESFNVDVDTMIEELTAAKAQGITKMLVQAGTCMG